MTKIKELDFNGITIFAPVHAEGEILSATFANGVDTPVEIREVDYKNAAGDNKSLKLALVPMLVDGKVIESVALNATMKFVVDTTNMDASYQLTAVATKDPRYTRLEFGILEE